MGEDGLESHISFFGNLGKRKERRGKSEQGFTFEMAVEKFKLFSAVGAEGQEPKASYGKRATIILNQFPPGTILREKFVRQQALMLSAEEKALFDDVEEYGIKPNEEKSDLEPEYTWWCVGSYDKEKSRLTLFDSSPQPDREKSQGYFPYNSPVYKFLEPSSVKMSFGHRSIKSNKKKEITFEIGKPGIILDDALESGGGFSKESIETWRRVRSTMQIDVMQFGIKEKVKEKVPKPKGQPSLVPQRVPVAA